MTRYFTLVAALLFGSAAFAQDTPADTTDGMTAEVADDSTAITFNPDRSRQLAEEGEALFGEGNYQGALDQFTLGLEYDSTYARNAIGKARSHYGLRQFNDAVAAYDLAIQLGTGVEGMSNIVARAREEKARIVENQSAQASAQELADKVTRATALIQAEPLSENGAQSGFDLLEEARMAGYDSTQVAYYYAKALNALSRHDDAVQYATIAVEQSEGTADRSAFFIQLGIAHKGAGNSDEAREAFTAAKEGAWASWADYYLNEMDSSEAGG